MGWLGKILEKILAVWVILLYIATSNYELIYNPSQSFGTISIPMSVFPIKCALDAIHFTAGNGWGAGAGSYTFKTSEFYFSSLLKFLVAVFTSIVFRKLMRKGSGFVL